MERIIAKELKKTDREENEDIVMEEKKSDSQILWKMLNLYIY